MHKIIYIINKILVFLILIGCSTSSSNKDSSINIKKISIKNVTTIDQNDNQSRVDLDLNGIVSDENQKQDIDYTWKVELLKVDVADENLFFDSKKDDKSDDKSKYINPNFLEGTFYLDASKSNPLNALLSIYKPGYFKITLTAKKEKNLNSNSIIVKINNPPNPKLFVKINLPNYKSVKMDDFKGYFYLSVSNNDSAKNKDNEIIKINASDMLNHWFNTNIEINPLKNFEITSGTHLIIDNDKIKISSIIPNNDNLNLNYISGNSNELKKIDTNPLIINNLNNATLSLSIKLNDSIKIYDGTVFIQGLFWNKLNNQFFFTEKLLNKNSAVVNFNYPNIYLTKIFIGSFGLRSINNNYFIFFGPEGTNIDDLDPKNEKEFPALPFGYLIGRLGNIGNIFPIGNNYINNYNNKFEILTF